MTASKDTTEVEPSAARLSREVSGQDLIEYALLAAFMGLSATAFMPNLSAQIATSVDAISGEVANVIVSTPAQSPPTQSSGSTGTSGNTSGGTGGTGDHHDRH